MVSETYGIAATLETGADVVLDGEAGAEKADDPDNPASGDGSETAESVPVDILFSDARKPAAGAADAGAEASVKDKKENK